MTDGTNNPLDVTPGELGNPEDLAAAFFMKEKPRLKFLLKNLSAKQLRRVIMYVASHPLTDPGDMPRTKDEKDAAYIFSEMSLNKSVLVLSAEMQKAEQALKKQEQEKSEDGLETN